MYRKLREVLTEKSMKDGNFDKIKKPKEKIWELMEETMKLSSDSMRKYISLLDLPEELQILLGKKNRLPVGYGIFYYNRNYYS